jgi:pyruvate-formate lyase-activating enzyme
VHLSELLALRPVPGAGLLVTVTRRCPLHCAHCSSDSTMAGGEPDSAALLRFVDSFAAAPAQPAADPRAAEDADPRALSASQAPEVLMLTGGEPLLRPDTVARLATSARAAGTRTAVLTGAFFARDDRVPRRVMHAIREVDHFSVSIDAFHEREVSRADVFRLLRLVLDAGIEVSVHATGLTADDPYLDSLITAVRTTFGDTVPLLVNTVRPVGRARGWSSARPVAPDGAVLPCPMAAWPVVAHDGVITACCNQFVVDRRPVPEHLALGHVGVDDWASVRARTLSSPVLRMLRVAGPDHLRSLVGDQDAEPAASPGYCAGCRRLGESPRILEAARRLGSGPLVALLDSAAAPDRTGAAAVELVRRWGSAPHADLVALQGRATR